MMNNLYNKARSIIYRWNREILIIMGSMHEIILVFNCDASHNNVPFSISIIINFLLLFKYSLPILEFVNIQYHFINLLFLFSLQSICLLQKVSASFLKRTCSFALMLMIPYNLYIPIKKIYIKVIDDYIGVLIIVSIKPL